MRLFERTNRRVRLTPAGERILARPGRPCGPRATQRAAQRARDGEAGLLRLGFVASAAFLRLPELLRGAARACAGGGGGAAAPRTRRPAPRPGGGPHRRRDRPRAPVSDVRWEVGTAALAPEPFQAVLPSEHPLAARRRLALADLAAEPWILSGTAALRSELVGGIHRMCAGAGFTPRWPTRLRTSRRSWAPSRAGWASRWCRWGSRSSASRASPRSRCAPRTRARWRPRWCGTQSARARWSGAGGGCCFVAADARQRHFRFTARSGG